MGAIIQGISDGDLSAPEAAQLAKGRRRILADDRHRPVEDRLNQAEQAIEVLKRK